MTDRSLRQVERSLRDVYGYCPPTLTLFEGEGRAEYERFWSRFMEQLGISPADFRNRTLLDVGCGSCEKAAFYHDWGAKVTGVELTPEILELGRRTIGARDIRLINSSIFDLQLPEKFDIVLSDGVLHHTADTFRALERCAQFVAARGLLVFGLVNIWGRFWWFKPARAVTRVLGFADFHRRAAIGQRLFGSMRGGQEHISGRAGFARSTESWAYDWFANPRWNAHSPSQLRRWLDRLGFEHVGSIPSLVKKPAETPRWLRRAAGDGPPLMELAWLTTGQPNMVYVCARKTAVRTDGATPD